MITILVTTVESKVSDLKYTFPHIALWQIGPNERVGQDGPSWLRQDGAYMMYMYCVRGDKVFLVFFQVLL